MTRSDHIRVEDAIMTTTQAESAFSVNVAAMSPRKVAVGYSKELMIC